MSYELLATSVDTLHTQVTGLTAGVQEALQRVAALTKVNATYPMTFVPAQVQYDVKVISGDPNATTAGMALWVEGTIVYPDVVDLSKFNLSDIENYTAQTQMRLIVNARYDDLFATVDEAYQGEKVARTQDYFNYLTGLQLENAVAYVGGLSIVRPTQAVTQGGVTYRPKATALPFTTTNWGVDTVKFTTAEDLAIRTDLNSPGGTSFIKHKAEGASSIPRTLQNKLWENKSVLDKGADPTGVVGCSDAIDLMLAEQTGGWTYLDFPPGRYLVNRQHELKAKTIIFLRPGAVLVHGGTDEMMFINGDKGNTTYANGYDGEGDIYILSNGGIVDLDATTGYRGMARFAHCRNILVRGLKVINGHRAHNIEINSCENALIEWCEFKDHRSPVGETNFETIQIDHAVAGGLPEFGSFDKTPCRSVTVRNCTFINVWSAFGCHSETDPVVGSHEGIHFHDNTIRGFRGMPFKFLSMRHSSAKRNNISGGASDARGPVLWSNQDLDIEDNILDMAGCTGLGWTIGLNTTVPSRAVRMRGNTVKNATNNPIYVTQMDGGFIAHSTFEGCAKPIYLNTAINTEVYNNHFEGGTSAYLVQLASTASGCSLKKNTGTFITAKYNTDQYLTEIDGETQLASGTFGNGAVITLKGPINAHRSIVLGSGSVGGNTFQTQSARGFTSVGFQLNSKILHPTATGLITLNVDSETQLTVVSVTGTDSLRFIYGVDKR